MKCLPKLLSLQSSKGTYNSHTVMFFTCSLISSERADHIYLGEIKLPSNVAKSTQHEFEVASELHWALPNFENFFRVTCHEKFLHFP